MVRKRERERAEEITCHHCWLAVVAVIVVVV